MTNLFALKTATIFAVLFGLIRLAATSGIPSVAAAAQPYVPLEYVFLFAAAYFWVYGLWGYHKIAVIVATLAAVIYFVIATGTGLR
jgi:hypothetical protein